MSKKIRVDAQEEDEAYDPAADLSPLLVELREARAKLYAVSQDFAVRELDEFNDAVQAAQVAMEQAESVLMAHGALPESLMASKQAQLAEDATDTLLAVLDSWDEAKDALTALLSEYVMDTHDSVGDYVVYLINNEKVQDELFEKLQDFMKEAYNNPLVAETLGETFMYAVDWGRLAESLAAPLIESKESNYNPQDHEDAYRYPDA